VSRRTLRNDVGRRSVLRPLDLRYEVVWRERLGEANLEVVGKLGENHRQQTDGPQDPRADRRTFGAAVFWL